MNMQRFNFLSQVLAKYIAEPDSVPYEKIVEYQKEYNNLLIQRDAEKSHYGENKGERRDALAMEKRVNVEFKTNYK